MVLKGQVLSSYTETRRLQGKDGGAPRQAQVAHVLMLVPADEKTKTPPEVYNIVSYDPAWELPPAGQQWTTPRIRRLECTGDVAEVSC